MMHAIIPMHQNKSLNAMMECAGDRDITSGMQCMMSACQSIQSNNSSDEQLLNYIRESKISTMSKDETLALWYNYLLLRDKM